MQSENRFFDDLAKMINGVAGTVAGAGREAEAAMRERAKEFVGRMDFVSREEFEAVKEMAARARAEAETLKARLDKLEERQSPQLRQSPWLRQRRLRRKRRRQSPAAWQSPKADTSPFMHRKVPEGGGTRTSRLRRFRSNRA
jgi:BMFP domain-containing protein YqiC